MPRSRPRVLEASRDGELAQAIFERSPLGIARVARDGRILQANQTLAEMLCVPVSQLVGAPVEQLVRLVHPDDLAALRADFRDLVDGGARARVRTEVRLRRSNADEFWASVTGAGLDDPEGYGLDYIVTIEDITERRRAEDALRQSEARFRTLVENASVAMALSDERGRLVETNPAYCSFLGYSAHELLKLTVTRLTHPEDRKAGMAAFKDLLQGRREVVHLEQRMLRRDGAVVWGLVTASLVENEAGRFVISMVQDMTERLRAERAVRESQEKSRFLATMSHELRTPLTSILGFGNLLTSESFGTLNERQRRHVQNIVTSGQHLLELVNELLDFGRIEAGQLDVPLTALPLRPVLDQCLAEVRPLADANGLQLTLSAEPDLTVMSNRLRLRQVVLNLLSNAIKFTGTGGKISVASEAVENQVRISVADSGVGIPVDMQERIFQEFSQGEDGAAREGTGLGLALSKRLVELMEGTLTVASQPGLGSRFIISLPRATVRGRRAGRRGRVTELAEMAYLDPLTSLPNRRAFEDAWKRELASAHRHGYPVAVALVDIDHFKQVNDKHGHLEGDRCLQAVGEVLRQTVRSADVVARLGGDEFVIALPYTNLEGALRIAERLRHMVATSDQGPPCNISVGVACTDQTPDEALLAIADKALYLAKSEGRNRVAAERP
jgi:diguanylate cyclase (GGDEF)-like protein/PAS domain S-box-containing protein